MLILSIQTKYNSKRWSISVSYTHLDVNKRQYLNKLDRSNLDNISNQIGKISSYYDGNINKKYFIFTNIKEYIRYLGLIGLGTLFFFTYPVAIIVFIVKAMSIGYTINTSIILLGFSSFTMCIIVFLKNIVIVPMSIILIELSIGYIKSVYKQLKKNRHCLLYTSRCV